MAGLSGQTSAGQVNQAFGQVALDVHRALSRAAEAYQFFQQNTDDEMVQRYGMDPADAAELRAAFDDLNALVRIYRGQDPLPVATNLRRNVRRIIGPGFV